MTGAVIKAILPPESVEGDKVEGHSRKPLRAGQRVLSVSGIRCRKFVAEHNVCGRVVQTPASATLLVPDANTAEGSKIECERAEILTTASKAPKSLVKKGSGTHKATFWRFVDQTAVTVLYAHTEVQEALRKRNSHQELGTAAPAKSIA